MQQSLIICHNVHWITIIPLCYSTTFSQVTIAQLAAYQIPQTFALLGIFVHFNIWVRVSFVVSNLQFCSFFIDPQIFLSDWCGCCHHVHCGYLFPQNMQIITFYVKLFWALISQNILLLWLRKLLPDWFDWCGTMSSGYVGFDNGSSEYDVFWSVHCWYGVFLLWRT